MSTEPIEGVKEEDLLVSTEFPPDEFPDPPQTAVDLGVEGADDE